jgi:transposase
VIIARLAAGLHCYEPEQADAVWARLRHLGARRSRLVTDATAEVNQVRICWSVRGQRFWVLRVSRSVRRAGAPRWPWCWTAVPVTWPGSGGWAWMDRFTAAVRRELPRWGAVRPCLRIVRAVFGALADSSGLVAHRPRALERAHLAVGDWRETRARLAEVEAWMAAVLDDLGLTSLLATIAGLTPVGAAAILAETGDPARFASPRSLVKHAGLCPRDNASGGYQGKTSISGRGRPRRPRPRE